MSGCQLNQKTTVFDVAKGAEVCADLPAKGVLRFNKKAVSPSGVPTMSQDDESLSFHFADGASVVLKLC